MRLHVNQRLEPGVAIAQLGGEARPERVVDLRVPRLPELLEKKIDADALRAIRGLVERGPADELSDLAAVDGLPPLGVAQRERLAAVAPEWEIGLLGHAARFSPGPHAGPRHSLCAFAGSKRPVAGLRRVTG